MSEARDADTHGVYTAEWVLDRWLEQGSVTAFGSTWVPEPQASFAAVADIQSYVDKVLTHIGCDRPIRVRRRRGDRRAHYETKVYKDGVFGVIAIPSERLDGSAWALKEATVLHEIAHHLARGDGHGPAFRAAHLDLLRRIGRPVHATLLGIAYAEEGLS